MTFVRPFLGRRPLRTLALLVGAVVLLVWRGAPPQGSLQALPASQTVTGTGSCDVDGVTTGYTVAYQTSKSFVVTIVNVSGIATTCLGGQVTVTLSSHTQDPIPGASGQATISGTTMPVPMTTPPTANVVTKVTVTLSGGSTPVPPQCSSMGFNNVQIGTTGNDNLTGTNGNDLIYSLSGVDSISGMQGNDCLNGGPSMGDNDTISDGNGNDVVLAGNGNDQVTVGNGTDLIKLGNGNDTVQTGNAGDIIYVGTGHDTISPTGNGNNTIYTGGRTGTALASGSAQAVSITVANGNNTIYLGNGSATVQAGNGNNTIYLGDAFGSGTINLGAGTNVCHTPLPNPHYTITHCTVKSP